MNDINKLQRRLEQATAPEGASQDNLEPETRSMREAWLDFGRLLEAGQPSEEISLDRWRMPRPSRVRRRLLTSGALVAASLLIGVAMTWMLYDANPLDGIVSPAVEKTAAINPDRATLIHQEEQTSLQANGLEWDDSLDEQIAQVGWDMIYARQDVYGSYDGGGSIQYGIEQMQLELEESNVY